MEIIKLMVSHVRASAADRVPCSSIIGHQSQQTLHVEDLSLIKQNNKETPSWRLDS